MPAGDADPPAGRFDSALSLLDQLAEMGSPFAGVGITGYPESHPKIGDDVTIQAMWDKRHHATYIVSNLCFDAGHAAALDRPGPGPRRHAAAATSGWPARWSGPGCCGWRRRPASAESARFLAGHAEWFLRLGTPGGYSPERLLDGPAPALADPASGRRRACTCSPSTRSSRPSSGAGRCSTGPERSEGAGPATASVTG